jgi:hypothetical protein
VFAALCLAFVAIVLWMRWYDRTHPPRWLRDDY